MAQPTPNSLRRRLIVTDEQVDTAVHDLLSMVTEVAEARERMIRAKHMVDYVRSRAIALSEHRNFDMKKAEAIATERYKDAVDEYAKAEMEWTLVEAKRDGLKMLIEVWRTQEASARAAATL